MRILNSFRHFRFQQKKFHFHCFSFSTEIHYFRPKTVLKIIENIHGSQMLNSIAIQSALCRLNFHKTCDLSWKTSAEQDSHFKRILSLCCYGCRNTTRFKFIYDLPPCMCILFLSWAIYKHTNLLTLHLSTLLQLNGDHGGHASQQSWSRRTIPHKHGLCQDWGCWLQQNDVTRLACGHIRWG